MHRSLLHISVVVFVRKVAVIVRPSALASNKHRHDADPDEVKTEKHPTETHGTPENTAEVAVVCELKVAVLTVVSQNSNGNNTSKAETREKHERS